MAKKRKVVELVQRDHCSYWGYAEQLDKMAKALRALSKQDPSNRLIAHTSGQFAEQSKYYFRLAVEENEEGQKRSLGWVYPSNR